MSTQTETKTDPKTAMVTFTIDDQVISVPKGTTVYQATKKLGIDIPIFCYQDRMPPFGACRVCLVEVEKMPKLQTSCTLEATEGMVVRTQSKPAVDGRESILEFLLINHPLDCPICDRGGECPLQDQALGFGPGRSRFFEEKRHFTKPVPRGPVLMLDRERCIICARCTRFGDIIAGDHALELLDRGFKSEVGTPNDGPAESKFIGNTIMICPVGALTSRVYRFRARPWDNDSTPSTCTLCPVGCNMIFDSRDGEVVRTRSQENRDLNDIWLCDKGWFGYEFANHPDRLQTPLLRKSGQLVPVSWEEALSHIALKIKEAIPTGRLAALGGNPLTTEENFLYQKLMRDVIHVNHIDHRVCTPLSNAAEGQWPGMQISIGECADLSFAVLLGIDLTEEFPVIWLRLKTAINKGAQVLFSGHYAPEIAEHLTDTHLHPPGSEINALQKILSQISSLAKEGKKGAFLIGRQYLNTPHREAILSQLSQFCGSHLSVSLNVLEGKNNSFGAHFAGMLSTQGPRGIPLSQPGLTTLQIFEETAKNGWNYLHVAGADPASKMPLELWNEARKKLGYLVVQDLFLTKTAKDADVVLPTLCFIEKEGTFLNIEGRIQKLRPGKKFPHEVYSDAEIFTLIAQLLGSSLTLDDDFKKALDEPGKKTTLPSKKNHSQKNLKADSNVSNSNGEQLLATFAPALFDHGVRMSHNPHLVQLAKPPFVKLHPKEAQKRGLKDGDEVRVVHQDRSFSAKIQSEETIALQTLVLPLGFEEEVPVHQLGTHLFNGMAVTLKKKNEG